MEAQPQSKPLELKWIGEETLDVDWFEAWDDDNEDPIPFLHMTEGEFGEEEAPPPPLFTSPRRNESSLNTDLVGATIVGGDFRKHSYSFMNITNCDLSFGNFRQANLISALVSCSDLSGSVFSGANLEYSEIEHSNFSHTDLTHADLEGTKFESVDFGGADLRGANLTDCIVHRCNFKGAMFDRHTRLPFSNARARQLGMVRHQPYFSDAG